MKKPTTRTLLIAAGIAGIAAIGTTGAVIAEHRYDDDDHHRGSMPYERMLHRLGHHLDLSAEQEEQLDLILEQHQQRFATQRAAVRDDLRELIIADEVSPADVNAVIDGIFDEGRRMGDNAAELFVAVHAILTPEQRAALAEGIAERWDDDGHGRRGWGWGRKDRHHRH